MNARVEHVDIAKGISITLVALHHSDLQPFVADATRPLGLVRMPLFFFLSGLFVAWAQPTGTFALKKADALLKPYLVVLLGLLAAHALAGRPGLATEAWGILWGNGYTIAWTPLWFLPHLFLVGVACHGLYRVAALGRWPGWARVGLVLALLAVGMVAIDAFWYPPDTRPVLSFDAPGLPLSLDLLPTTAAFFLAGAFLRTQVLAFRPHAGPVLLAAAAFAAVALGSAAQVNLHKRVVDLPGPAAVGAFSGIYLVLALSWALTRLPSARVLLCRLGAGSLYILIFHGWIGRRVFRMGSPEGTDATIAWAAVAFALSVLLPLGLQWATERSAVLALLFKPLAGNPLLRRRQRAP
jgi:fucose 4-O-acetylase-like acetyltransferase